MPEQDLNIPLEFSSHIGLTSAQGHTRTNHRLPDYFLVISVTVVSGWLFTYFLDTNLPVFALLWILRVEPFFAM